MRTLLDLIATDPSIHPDFRRVFMPSADRKLTPEDCADAQREFSELARRVAGREGE